MSNARKHRVPLHGKPTSFVEVEQGATRGAVVGVNVWNQDGSLFVPATGSATPSQPQLLWRLLLEVPPNIQGLASLTGTGVVRRVGTGTFGTDAGLNDLSDVDAPTPSPGDVLGFDGEDWVSTEAPSGGVPYFIPEGSTFRVREYLQALFAMPIDVEGFLEVDGFLVEVD